MSGALLVSCHYGCEPGTWKILGKGMMTLVASDGLWPNGDILRGLETEIATFLLFPIILYIFSQYLLKFEERVSQQKSSNIFPNESSSLLF